MTTLQLQSFGYTLICNLFAKMFFSCKLKFNVLIPKLTGSKSELLCKMANAT